MDRYVLSEWITEVFKSGEFIVCMYSNRKVWAVWAVFAEQNVIVNAIAKLYVTKSFTKGWNW